MTHLSVLKVEMNQLHISSCEWMFLGTPFLLAFGFFFLQKLIDNNASGASLVLSGWE